MSITLSVDTKPHVILKSSSCWPEEEAVTLYSAKCQDDTAVGSRQTIAIGWNGVASLIDYTLTNTDIGPFDPRLQIRDLFRTCPVDSQIPMFSDKSCVVFHTPQGQVLAARTQSGITLEIERQNADGSTLQYLGGQGPSGELIILKTIRPSLYFEDDNDPLTLTLPQLCELIALAYAVPANSRPQELKTLHALIGNSTIAKGLSPLGGVRLELNAPSSTIKPRCRSLQIAVISLNNALLRAFLALLAPLERLINRLKPGADKKVFRIETVDDKTVSVHRRRQCLGEVSLDSIGTDFGNATDQLARHDDACYGYLALRDSLAGITVDRKKGQDVYLQLAGKDQLLGHFRRDRDGDMTIYHGQLKLSAREWITLLVALFELLPFRGSDARLDIAAWAREGYSTRALENMTSYEAGAFFVRYFGFILLFIVMIPLVMFFLFRADA